MIFVKSMHPSQLVRVRTKISLDLTDVYTDCHNVQRRSAGLAAIGHFELQHCPHRVKKAAFWASDELYLLCEDGLFTLSQGQEQQLELPAVPADVSVTRHGNNVLVATPNGTYKRDNGTAMSRVTVRGYDTLLTAGTRVFALGNRGLTVTSVDPTQWTDSYDVQLTADELASVGNRVYLLGDTCYAYDVKDDPIGSRCYPIAHNLGKVQRGSAVTVGNRVFFAAEQGVYTLYGERAERLELDERLRFDGATACALLGRYLISCKRSERSKRNDITLLVDDKGVTGVFEYGFDSLACHAGHVYGVLENELYAFEYEGSLSVFKRENIDMGSQKMKYLDMLRIRTDNYCDLWLHSDGVKRLYTFAPSPYTQAVHIGGRGRTFGIELQSDEGLSVQLLELCAHAQQEE